MISPQSYLSTCLIERGPFSLEVITPSITRIFVKSPIPEGYPDDRCDPDIIPSGRRLVTLSDIARRPGRVDPCGDEFTAGLPRDGVFGTYKVCIQTDDLGRPTVEAKDLVGEVDRCENGSASTIHVIITGAEGSGE